MKTARRLFALTIALGLLPFSAVARENSPAPAPSAPTNPPAPAVTEAKTAPATAATELPLLIEKIKTRLHAGANTEAALAGEIAEFDALFAKYKGEKTDDVANILLMKAMLYVQVFENAEKGLAFIRQIKADFPDTKPGKEADRLIEAIEARGKAAAIQAALVGKPAPALNFTWASRPGLKSLADVKGKVVVLDFWATWCGPCVHSFPQIAEVVAHYQGYDVEVIGVTSLQGRVANLEPQPIDCKGDPAKETGLMPAFMQAKHMTWTVAFSAEEVFNPAYAIEGIPYMAILAPDGTIRHTALHPALPLEEKVEKIDAILKEFNLKVPAKS